MFKRAARDAVRKGLVTMPDVAGLTDGELMHLLAERDRHPLARALRDRRLFKRSLDLPASEVTARPAAWISEDAGLLERVEDALAAETGLEPGELLLDFPARHSMLGVDLPLRLRDGTVERLTDEGRAGHLGLPRIAGELYRSARRLRVFVARTIARPLEGVARLLELSGEDLAGTLAGGGPLLEPGD